MKYRRLLAFYLANGTFWVLWTAVTVLDAAPQGQQGWRFAVFLLLGLALGVAAYLTWRGHPAAWAVGVALQLPQLLSLQTDVFGYWLYAPLSVVVGCSGSVFNLTAQAHIGAAFAAGPVRAPTDWTVGLNIAPLLVLWLMDRMQAETLQAAIARRAA